MDQTDLNILNVMKQNSRASVSEISKRVNLSIPAVSERIRKLEEANVIEQYTIKINRKKMGYNLLALIFVCIDQTAHIDNFRTKIIEFPEVMECHHMAGEYDYLLKVLVKDSSELEYFLSKQLKSIQGVSKSNSMIILSTLKESDNR